MKLERDNIRDSYENVW